MVATQIFTFLIIGLTAIHCTRSLILRGPEICLAVQGGVLYYPTVR